MIGLGLSRPSGCWLPVGAGEGCPPSAGPVPWQPRDAPGAGWTVTALAVTAGPVAPTGCARDAACMIDRTLPAAESPGLVRRIAPPGWAPGLRDRHMGCIIL